MQRTNEQSLDLFADLLEPVAEILADDEVKEAYSEKKIRAIKVAIKNHKSAVIEIMSLIEGIPADEYKVDIVTLPLKILNFLNRPEINDLFTQQAQMNAAAFSGPAMESTEDGAN